MELATIFLHEEKDGMDPPMPDASRDCLNPPLAPPQLVVLAAAYSTEYSSYSLDRCFHSKIRIFSISSPPLLRGFGENFHETSYFATSYYVLHLGEYIGLYSVYVQYLCICTRYVR